MGPDRHSVKLTTGKLSCAKTLLKLHCNNNNNNNKKFQAQN